MRENIVSCLNSQYRRLTKPIQPSEPNQSLIITTLFLIKTQKTIGDSLKTLGIVIKVGIRAKIELDNSKRTSHTTATTTPTNTKNTRKIEVNVRYSRRD